MVLILGIDESGRGPVIGPLVMAGVLIEENDEAKLRAIKVKDSKVLTAEIREELFDRIVAIAQQYEILIVPPSEIDDAVKGNNGSNLNKLEGKKMIEIVNKLKPDKAYIDAPSNNIKAYKEFLFQMLANKKTQLILEHKADATYPVVSAASILAKVTRDREIEKIKQEIGVDFGTGYMSDPKTASFLEKNYDRFPDIIRKSWSSYRDAAQKKFQSTLSNFSQFVKEESDAFKKLERLKEFGYEKIETKSTHEIARYKGVCTVTLYSSGKINVQGPQEQKKQIEEFLGIKD